RLSEDLEVLDSRFHGNDEKVTEITKSRDDGASARPSFSRRRESRTSGNGNIQRLSESLRF
ncbi:hypothetical protein NEILACOT_04223, partial [Neisseria lactamica ATCC 23970]